MMGQGRRVGFKMVVVHRQGSGDASSTACRRFGRACVVALRRFLTFLFSQAGLSAAVVGYTILGGIVFAHLERANEVNECVKSELIYRSRERGAVDDLNELLDARQRGDVSPDRFNETLGNMLQQFREKTLDIGSYTYTIGSDCEALAKFGDVPGKGKWTFSGSLLFSVTVFTTIGYGNIAPRTFWGRMVCIAYAMLGIPLMFTWLSYVGGAMGTIFRGVYSNICCCNWCRRFQRPTNEQPEPQRQQDHGIGEQRTDQPVTASGGVDEGQQPEQRNEIQMTDLNAVRPTPTLGEDLFVHDTACDTSHLELRFEEITVPLTITLAVVAAYLLLGAVLFGIWDGWGTMKATYYSFVTISTIGFGDVVPGSTEFKEDSDKWKLVFASLYVMIGMALLSMSFDLVRDEFAEKVRRITRRLGLGSE